MQSQRLVNHADNPFGKALEHLIENKKSADAKLQIEIIQSNEGILNSIDDKGRTFLTHALDKKMYDTASIILELLKDEDALFSVDSDGRSALHVAVNHETIANRLVEIAVQKGRLKEYLIQDKAGNTFLHAPLCFHNDDIMKMLLSIIYDNMRNKPGKFRAFINILNKKRETPLHFAFRLDRKETFKTLIKYGADLTLKDNTGIAPILFFATIPTEQELIFLSLEKENQKAVLSAYRELLIQYNDNKLLPNLTNDDYKEFLKKNDVLINLKENYYRLTKYYDCKTSLIAMYEFDNRIVVKKTYQKTIENKDEIIIIPNMPWDVKLLEQMPLYTKKLGYITRYESDLENEDDILTNLINSMGNMVEKIRGETCYASVNKTLALLIPMIWCVGIICLDIWLFMSYANLSLEANDEWMNNAESNRHGELEDQAIPYLIGGLLVTFLGILSVGLLLPSLLKLSRRELTISSDEYQPILDQVEGILVNRLKAKHQEKKLSYVMKNNLNELESGIEELNERGQGCFANFFAPRKPVSRVTAIFTRLKDIVSDIRSIVLKEKNPLGLKRLPSSIGLFKPKPPSPYRLLPAEGFLEFPEENYLKLKDSDTSSSSDEDKALLSLYERKGLTKQEITESLLGKDWEAPQEKRNFRY